MATRKKPSKKSVVSKKRVAKKSSAKQSTRKPSASKKTSKKKPAPKKAARKKASPKKAAATRKPAQATTLRDETRTRAKTRSRGQQSSSPPLLPEASGLQSGDLQGLSNVENVDAESVDELLEEGNAFEAGIVSGVEDSRNREGKEVRTRQVPEDDVPQEYLDEE